jgi:hypothetical protein
MIFGAPVFKSMIALFDKTGTIIIGTGLKILVIIWIITGILTTYTRIESITI